MNPLSDPNQKNRIFRLIYLACAVICVLRALISLAAGSLGAAVLRLILAGVLFIVFFRYSRNHE